MIIDNPNKEQLREYNDNLFRYITANNTLEKILYLDLGVKTVRILCYSSEFVHHIQKQLTYAIRENADIYDATIVLWKENDIKQIYKYIVPNLNPRNNFRRRIEMLQLNKTCEDLWIYSKQYSINKPLLYTDFYNDIFNSYDKEK